MGFPAPLFTWDINADFVLLSHGAVWLWTGGPRGAGGCECFVAHRLESTPIPCSLATPALTAALGVATMEQHEDPEMRRLGRPGG